MGRKATARAHANIALVKYWGNRDARLNLPAAGSLSLTLDALHTTTSVSVGGAAEDTLLIDGAPADERALARALRVVGPLRARAGLGAPLLIESRNSFPTGAGLASSASGMAALALAAARALGLELEAAELSAAARLGSGSACRSIFGGYVEWRAGSAPDGSDSHALELFAPEHWDLRCVVAVISSRPKAVSSSDGMAATAASSPYHAAFVAGADADVAAGRAAIAARDLAALARVAERSCLRMHAAMLAAEPALLYLKPESWAAFEAARRLRAAGVPAFFTADAGPNVKVFCAPEAEERVARALGALAGVERLIHARPGPGASVVD